MSDQGLTEQCVGITEFLSPPDTFEKITGIIKARYSDFNVYEIDKKGNTIHLTDFGPGNSWDSIQNYFVAKRAKGKEDIYSKKLDQNEVSSLVEEIPLENATFEEPKQLIEETVEPNEEASVHELIQEEANIENANLVNEKTGLIVTEEIRQNISDFMIATFGEVDLAAHMVELIEKKRFQGETCLVFPSVSDKQRRTKIHFFVKELSSKIENVLVTDTIDKDKIRVSYRFPNSRKRKQDFDDRNHLNVTEKRADFIICHMYKENKDTMEASSRISSALRYLNYTL